MPSSPTPTSYAILGLLSVRSWTTYELAQQVRRSLSWFWPRAERKLYDEPKQLAERGWASATEKFTGKRRSREYTITEQGRDALRAWLAEPAAPRSTEFEGMVKVFFADAGDLEALRSTLHRIAEEAQARARELGAFAAGPLGFPHRQHLSALTLALGLDQELAVLRWARWAEEQVASWDDTTGRGWDAAGALRDVARRALDETGEPGSPATSQLIGRSSSA
jgi:PadR family transcriptional regulator, regulatory protein AphA